MMKANELRIGNVVETRSNKRGWIRYEITGLNIYQLSAYSENFEKDVRPIPITDDLLLECGFFQDADNRLSVILLKIGLLLMLMIVVFELLTVGCLGKSITLHELQNLYFTLTGEELKINTQDR
jgi:hypothetical protein